MTKLATTSSNKRQMPCWVSSSYTFILLETKTKLTQTKITNPPGSWSQNVGSNFIETLQTEKNMETITKILIAMISLEHLYFMYLEMFAWETIGKKTFKSLPEHLFKPTKGLAANQGLYNGFLAAGLFWTFLISDTTWSKNVALFFLTCVAIAGIYGAMSEIGRAHV